MEREKLIPPVESMIMARLYRLETEERQKLDDINRSFAAGMSAELSERMHVYATQHAIRTGAFMEARKAVREEIDARVT